MHESRIPVDRLVLGLFVLSGAASLVYQTVWSRELVLLFGNTSQAIATVVTAFMAGLGFGGLTGAWLVRRFNRPLRLYGAIEVLVGLLAILLPAAFGSFGEVYRSVYATATPFELDLIRLGLSLVAVTPVTFLMGMTLPILTAYTVATLPEAGHRIGQLYAANTLGAVLGTMVAGFVLIELLGLSLTADVGVAMSISAGLLALLLDRLPGQVRPAHSAASASTPAAPILRLPRSVILFATFISGFIALALEVLWTRLLSEGLGATIYLFVLILAVYLLGIACGSSLYSRLSHSARDTLTMLGACFVGIGLMALVTVVVGSGVMGDYRAMPRLLIVLPATILMGFAFPLSARLLTRTAAEAPSSVGSLYAFNTLGSILGSFSGVFLLAPHLGTNSSILLIGTAGLALGGCLVALDRGLPARAGAPPAAFRPVTVRSSAGALIGLLAVTSLAAVATGQPVTMTSTQNHIHQYGWHDSHAEDEFATVDAVSGSPRDRRLFVGGIGITAHTVDTKLMAYLPKALRPDARDLLVIGFGMGSTYRSGLILGMRTNAVELSPSVARDMPVFYPDANRYLHDPNGRVIVTDGRNYVRLTSERYDLIAVDPPPPIESAGTVLLYSREFLREGRALLRPGGVFMLFMPFGGSIDDFRDHVRTFRDSFAHAQLVISPGGYGAYMLGSERTIDFDPAGLERLLGSDSARVDFADAPDDPGLEGPGWRRLIAHASWLRDGQLDAFAGRGGLITDDRPLSEYYLLHWVGMKDKRTTSERVLRELSGT
jgi:spermidine synthase